MGYLVRRLDQSGKPRERWDVLGGTLAGRNANELARELDAIHQIHPGITAHILQTSIRFSEDEPGLTDEKWLDLAKRWTTKMGVEAYVVVAHSSREVHIACSRIRLDGSLANDWQSIRRSESAIRQIEKEMGLHATAPSHLLNPAAAKDHRKSPTRADFARAERGEVQAAYVVREALDRAMAKPTTVTELIDYLNQHRIEVVANVASTGRMAGLSYLLDGKAVSAKQMGRGYTWANLTKKGLSYDLIRDRAAVSRKQPREAKATGTRPAEGDDGGDGSHESRAESLDQAGEARPGERASQTGGQSGQDHKGDGTDHGSNERDACSGRLSEPSRSSLEPAWLSTFRLRLGLERIEDIGERLKAIGADIHEAAVALTRKPTPRTIQQEATDRSTSNRQRQMRQKKPSPIGP